MKTTIVFLLFLLLVTLSTQEENALKTLEERLRTLLNEEREQFAATQASSTLSKTNNLSGSLGKNVNKNPTEDSDKKETVSSSTMVGEEKTLTDTPVESIEEKAKTLADTVANELEEKILSDSQFSGDVFEDDKSTPEKVMDEVEDKVMAVSHVNGDDFEDDETPEKIMNDVEEMILSQSHLNGEDFEDDKTESVSDKVLNDVEDKMMRNAYVNGNDFEDETSKVDENTMAHPEYGAHEEQQSTLEAISELEKKIVDTVLFDEDDFEEMDNAKTLGRRRRGSSYSSSSYSSSSYRRRRYNSYSDDDSGSSEDDPKKVAVRLFGMCFNSHWAKVECNSATKAMSGLAIVVAIVVSFLI